MCENSSDNCTECAINYYEYTDYENLNKNIGLNILNQILSGLLSKNGPNINYREQSILKCLSKCPKIDDKKNKIIEDNGFMICR